MTIEFCHTSKMNKCNSIEAIDKINLSEQTKFRLDEISKIENYFIEEINQRKSCNTKLSKYIAAFDYIEKNLVILSGTIGGVSSIHLQLLLVQELELQVQVVL